MSKHSKGEWAVSEPLDMEGMHHIFLTVNGKHAGRIDGHLNGESCGEKGYPNREETIANAHLIAAAPVQNQVLTDIYTDAELLPDGRFAITEKRLQDIITAIAKARK